MGVYSTNRHQVSGINLDDIVANESYTGNIGIEKMIIENHENDMAIFEALLKNDIQEVAGLKEGTILESELASINEASVKGIWEAIKKAILSFFAKIKNILKSFREKFLDTVEAANKKLLASAKGKIEKKDLSKLTYKWRDDSKYEAPDLAPVDERFNRAFDELKGPHSVETAEETIAKYSDGKLLNELLTLSVSKIEGIGEVTAETFAKTYEEHCLGKETEIKGLDSKTLNHIIDDLGDWIPFVKRWFAQCESDMNKEVKSRLKAVDAESKKVIENKDDAAAAAKVAEGCRLAINSWQTASLTTISAHTNVIKLKAAQDRSIVTKALMFNPKKAESVNASALFDAIDECTMSELDELALCY